MDFFNRQRPDLDSIMGRLSVQQKSQPKEAWRDKMGDKKFDALMHLQGIYNGITLLQFPSENINWKEVEASLLEADKQMNILEGN